MLRDPRERTAVSTGPVHAEPLVTTPTKGPSYRHKILRAALQIERSGLTRFTYSRLIVESFRLYPESFSLPDYPEYPHSSRVLAKMHGSEGLVFRGMLEEVDDKISLTKAGRAMAEVIDAGEKPTARPRGRAKREPVRDEAVEPTQSHPIGTRPGNAVPPVSPRVPSGRSPVFSSDTKTTPVRGGPSQAHPSPVFQVPMPPRFAGSPIVRRSQ